MITRSTIRTRTCIALKLSLSLMLASGVACNRAEQQPEPRPTPETPLERGIRQARSQLAKNIYTISLKMRREMRWLRTTTRPKTLPHPKV